MANVKKFYNFVPFNIGNDANENNIPWPILVDKLQECDTVTELGCGTGWLSARIKNKFPNAIVKGIDISDAAIEQAKMRSADVNFCVDDITTYNGVADMIISVGVLHHIPNHSIEEMIAKAIRASKKYTFIGVYHKNSRQAMFDFFNQYPKSKHKKLFKKMSPQIKNSVQRDSWFRDQFEHPYEVSICLDTLQKIAKDTNTKLIYTSLNTDDMYNTIMNKLQTFEFVSGFVYGVFENEMA